MRTATTGRTEVRHQAGARTGLVSQIAQVQELRLATLLDTCLERMLRGEQPEQYLPEDDADCEELAPLLQIGMMLRTVSERSVREALLSDSSVA
jgi:hypothetical protein